MCCVEWETRSLTKCRMQRMNDQPSGQHTKDVYQRDNRNLESKWQSQRGGCFPRIAGDGILSRSIPVQLDFWTAELWAGSKFTSNSVPRAIATGLLSLGQSCLSCFLISLLTSLGTLKVWDVERQGVGKQAMDWQAGLSINTKSPAEEEALPPLWVIAFQPASERS